MRKNYSFSDSLLIVQCFVRKFLKRRCFLNMTIRMFSYQTDDYGRSLVFRNAVLRIPLGQDLFAEDTTCDKHDFHFGMFDSADRFAGILILTKLDEKTIKMRQVGIREDLRGQGFGKQLVAYAEAYARELGFQKIVLNARKNAIAFYLSMSYNAEGEEFFEVGIPHQKMSKQLF